MRKNKLFIFVFSLILCIGTFFRSSVSVHGQNIPESKGECVMEVETRRVLYAQNADTRLPMASTTKIVTCITVLSLCKNVEEKVVIPTEAVGIEGSSVYLKAGDTYTVKELLYGLMLRSGNDCAVALALYCQGSIARFAVKMNEFAESAGALHSRFSNPHGLPAENHYTTAYDLALITCKAMQNPVFCEIVATQYYAPKHWQNKNKMLYNYSGANGVKTGFTKEAGRCLVSSATRENMRLVSVVLNSPMMFERSADLLDGAFTAYRWTKVLSKGERISENNVTGVAREDFYYPLSEGEYEHVERRIKPVLKKNKQGIVGEFEIYLTKRLLFSGNLYKL